MGLLRSILSLPISGPLNGTLWVADKVYEAADKDMNDPATLRKELIALEQKLLAGKISEAAYDDAETVLLHRLRAVRP